MGLVTLLGSLLGVVIRSMEGLMLGSVSVKRSARPVGRNGTEKRELGN